MGSNLAKRNDNNKFKRTQNRIVSHVPMPIKQILTIEDLFDDLDDPNKPNLIKLRNHLVGEGRVDSKLALKIIELTDSILKGEPNVLKIDSPVNIIGDIHGQFYDLLTIFTLGGSPENFKYLFMGDFVDRGIFAFECVCYLYCLKIRYPEKIYLLRGNHESRHLTRFFTFRDECIHKSNELVYEKCMFSFDSLPISAVLDGKIFCVHGGLSPYLTKLSDLDKENRFNELPKNGLLCDLMWSDPVENFDNRSGTTKIKKSDSKLLSKSTSSKTSLKSLSSDSSKLKLNKSKTFDTDYFIYNSSRGCSFNYTQLAVERFLRENNLLCVIRAHQVQREGVHLGPCLLTKESASGSKRESIGFPSLISLFSAPNYCDVYQNKAAIIQYTRERFSIKLFTASDHPFVLPSFQNAFTWSLPFIFEKLSDLLVFVLNQISDQEPSEERQSININKVLSNSSDKRSAEKQQNQGLLNKLNILKKYRDVYKKTNQLTSSDLKLGTLTPTNRLRRRSSDADRELLIDLERKGVKSFEDADNLDALQYKIINSDDESENEKESPLP